MPIKENAPCDPMNRIEFHLELLRWSACDVGDIRIDGQELRTPGGGRPLLHVAAWGNTYHLNADTTRDAVREYLALVLRFGSDLEWVPMSEEKNRIGFRSEQIAPIFVTNFFLYIDR
jgi:hypothetical protein